MKRAYTKRPTLDRLLEKVSINPISQCWEWTASLDKKGYGQFELNGRNRRAHEVAYELLRGIIPDGLEPDHVCKNTRCINPDHLEPVTHRENVLRGTSPMAINARKTHCGRGHELSGRNLGVRDGGNRYCKRCSADNLRKWYRNNREHNREYQRRRDAAQKGDL